MPGAYKNQCKSEFNAPLYWKPTEIANHQCNGSEKCKGPHSCGCGFEWDDIAAAASAKLPAERTAMENALIDAIVKSVVK